MVVLPPFTYCCPTGRRLDDLRASRRRADDSPRCLVHQRTNSPTYDQQRSTRPLRVHRRPPNLAGHHQRRWLRLASQLHAQDQPQYDDPHTAIAPVFSILRAIGVATSNAARRFECADDSTPTCSADHWRRVSSGRSARSCCAPSRYVSVAFRAGAVPRSVQESRGVAGPPRERRASARVVWQSRREATGENAMAHGAQSRARSCTSTQEVVSTANGYGAELSHERGP